MHRLETVTSDQNPAPLLGSRQAIFPGIVQLPGGELLALFSIGQAFDAADTRAYLSRMARGLCVDLWRRREVEQAWLDTLAHHGAEAPSAEQQTAALEALIEVDTMLKRLPSPVAQAFIQSMVHGLSGKQIATQLGVTERTVRNYLSRAMLACLRLQARLEDTALPATGRPA